MENFGEKSIISAQAKKDIEESLKEHGKKLEKPAYESEGFLYIPAEHIKIIPPSEGESNGVVEIYEPEEKIGTEDFDLRNKFEEAWPVGDFASVAAWENRVFDGEISPESFSPEVGGRFCFASVNIYETKEGAYMLMPIHPKEDEKYRIIPKRGEQAKLGGTSMLRGDRWPKAAEVFGSARNKVTHNLTDLQKENPEEKIISRPSVMPTGMWTLRLFNQRGKYSEIKNCHIQRDPSTGTLDAISIQKQYIFEEFDNLHPRENIPLGLERANALVSLDKLKETEEGKLLGLERIYYAGKQIKDPRNLPEKYHSMFEEKEGKVFLKNFRATPPLRAFLELEKKIVRETSKDMEGEIRQKIGELFEKLAAQVLGKEKNSEDLKIKVPESEELEILLRDCPEAFRDWTRSQMGKEIIVRPDFILEDGTFVEVKTGGKLELKPEKREQIFRMVLYKLVRKEDLKIRLITLEGETIQDPIFSFLKYENFFETELAKKATERDLKPIRMWQKFLSK